MRVVQLESFLDGTGVIVEGRGSRQRGGVLGAACAINAKNRPVMQSQAGFLLSGFRGVEIV